jgi:hypothetical protein
LPRLVQARWIRGNVIHVIASRCNGLTELGDHIGIDAVRLREASHCLRELSNLTRIGDNYGQICSCESGNRCHLVPPGRFEHDALGLHLLHALDQLGNAAVVVLDDEAFPGWSCRHDQLSFRNVDAYVHLFLLPGGGRRRCDPALQFELDLALAGVRVLPLPTAQRPLLANGLDRPEALRPTAP